MQTAPPAAARRSPRSRGRRRRRPHRRSPRARHGDPEHMPADRGQDPEVKDRARVLEHRLSSSWLERARPDRTGRAGSAAVPDHEHRQGGVGEHGVGEHVPWLTGSSPRASASAGGANGSSPTSSCAGPSAASRLIRASLPGPSRGSASTTASSRGANGLASRAKPADELDRDPVLLEQRHPGVIGDERRELEHQRQVIRQLVPGGSSPARPIGLLESQQGHAALSVVAVDVVGEVEAALLAEVEGLDVAAAARRPAASPRTRRRARPQALGHTARSRARSRPRRPRRRPRATRSGIRAAARPASAARRAQPSPPPSRRTRCSRRSKSAPS